MAYRGIQIFVQVVATVILLGAVGALIAGIVTPAWQTVHIYEFGQTHQHGLWMDCVSGRRQALQQVDQWICSYKFAQEDHVRCDPRYPQTCQHQGHQHQQGELQHQNLPWHKTTLALLCVAAFFGILALLFSFCAPCVKPCGIVWALMSVIATGLNAAGLLVFFFNSQKNEYRYLHSVARSYEQELDYSFYCALGGCIAFLVSTILAILAVVLLFVGGGNDRRSRYPKTNPAAVAYSWPSNPKSQFTSQV